MSYDCFISYARADVRYAEALDNRLITAGFSVWFDRVRLREGCDWHREIEKGCESSRIVLPVLSPAWKGSEWTRYETYGAEAIIPVLAEGAWQDVLTPPLRSLHVKLVPLLEWNDDDWGQLFAQIRHHLERRPPEKVERLAWLPIRANPNFVGRVTALEDIHEKLFTHPATVLTQGRVGILTALGGVGKTALARHYAEKFWRAYHGVFWIDCRHQLVGEFARVHDLMRPGLMYQALSDPEKANWVRQELCQPCDRPIRLLILDNAEDQQSVLEWIPTTGNCHTLITSRYAEWDPAFEICQVPLLEPEAARKLLLRRAGKLDSSAEVAIVDAVAHKLGYLPLALEQAAAYVENQGPGYQYMDYLRLYTEHEARLLAQWSSDWSSTDYPRSVLLTWRATIDKLSAGARATLRLCSFFASAPIPAGMLAKGASIIEGVAAPAAEHLAPVGEVEANEWKAHLAKYSMVQLLNDQTFLIHSLVQAVERHQEDADSRPRLIKEATRLLMAWAPRESWLFDNWKSWRLLVPHATFLKAQYDSQAITPDADFLREFGSYLNFQGQYADAEPLLRQALTLRESQLGSLHTATASSLNDLGILLFDKADYDGAEEVLRRGVEIYDHLGKTDSIDASEISASLAMVLGRKGRLKESEALFREALATSESLLGPDDPHTLTVINNLADVLSSGGDYEEAGRLLRRVLEGRERRLEGEHPDGLTALNNLALNFWARNDYASGEPLFRRALEAQERILGLEHPSTLLTVYNLAVLLRCAGDLASAEPLCRRALESRTRLLGPEHRDTLLSMNELSNLLIHKGDLAGAEVFARQTAEIQERTLGPEHPETLVSVSGVATILHYRGDHAAARRLYERVLEISDRVIGQTHPNTITTVVNLSLVLGTQADWDGAEALLRRALKACEHSLGQEHPSTLAVLTRLARLLLDGKGDFRAAEDMFRQLHSVYERTVGSEHTSTLVSLNNAAFAAFRQGDLERAEVEFRAVIEAYERVNGREDPATMWPLNSLAAVLRDRGNLVEAESLFRYALEVRERVLGPDHPDTLISVAGLGVLLYRRGEHGTARALLERALEGQEKALGSEHPRTLTTVNDLGCVLEATGDYAAAGSSFQRAFETRTRVLGASHPDAVESRRALAALLERMGHSP